MLKNFEAQPDHARKYNIGSQSIGDANSEDPGQPAVRRLKHHEDDQPDREDPQPGDRQALH